MSYWYQSGHNWYWNPNPNTKPGNLYGYSYEAITDPDQKPPDYAAANPPPAPPPDVYIPEVHLADGWPPPLTGNVEMQPPPPSDPNAPPKPPPSVAAFHVVPNTIRDAETRILACVKTAIDEFQQLKAYVDSHVDWVFYKASAHYEHNPPSTEAQAMVTYVNSACLGAADALTLTGRGLVSNLNAAVQLYVRANNESTFPAD